MGKGEIACYEQYLIFQQCFSSPMKAFENIVGKGENAGNQHFLLFPHNVFYPFQTKFQNLNYIEFVIYKSFQLRPV